MLSSAIPTRVQLPFAAGAGGAFIRTVPVPSQIGLQNGAASFTDGFPPLTMQPIASGGVPPFGEDFNGLLNVITAWNRWQAAGAPIPWDSAFSVAIGGYPLGAVIASATPIGGLWINSLENNLSNPDAGGAGWSGFSYFGIATTGDIKLTIKTVADPGWLLINSDAFTIGNTGSGAAFASSLALPLFSMIWSGVSNSFAPVQPSGRGANPAADFAALKTITFPRVIGRALGAAGAGIGLTSRALGQFLGEESHLQTLAELVSHLHGISDPGHLHAVNDPTHVHPTNTGGGNQAVAASGQGYLQPGANATGAAASGVTLQPNVTSISVVANGGGAPFNVMQPTTFLNLMVKV